MIIPGLATVDLLRPNSIGVGEAFSETIVTEDVATIDQAHCITIIDENIVNVDSSYVETTIEEPNLVKLALIDVNYFGISNDNTASETFTSDTNLDLVNGVSPSTFSSYSAAGGMGNRGASITVTSSGLTTTAGTFDNLVDGGIADNSTDSFYFINAIAVAGTWIKFNFGSSTRVSELTWKSSTAVSQGVWVVEGSTNDSDWTPVSSNFTLGASATTVVAITSPGDYQYYRMLGVSGSTTNTVWHREIEFKIVDPTARVFTSVNSTTEAFPFSYTNSRSAGNRSSLITVTSENLTIAGGGVQSLVNGNFGVDGTNAFYFSTVQSLDNTRRIHFDFQVPVTIIGLKWYQNTPTSQGVWDLQGSVDNGTWVTVAPSITLASATTTTNSVTSPGSYRYYRLAGVSGSTNNSTWNTEIEFELSETGLVSKTLQSVEVITRNSRSAKLAFSLVGSLSNVTAFISKDDGTTWASTTLTDTGRTTTINSFTWRTIESDIVDMTPQTGSQFKYRIVVGTGYSAVRSVALLASGLEE